MTTTYYVTRDQVIRAALRKIGIGGTGENPSAEVITDAAEALNMLVKNWQDNLWTRTEAVLFPTANKQFYSLGAGSTDHVCNVSSLVTTSVTVDAAMGATSITVADASSITSGMTVGFQVNSTTFPWSTTSGTPVGNVVTLTTPLASAVTASSIVYAYATSIPRPIGIDSARRRTAAGTDVPISAYVRDQYFALPMKSSTGPINTFYYDPQLTAGIMYVWPVASDLTEQVRFTYQRPISDMDYTSDIPEYPQEWYRALVYNLAYDLTFDYGIVGEVSQKLQLEAVTAFNTLKGRDTDTATYIRPVFDVRSSR